MSYIWTPPEADRLDQLAGNVPYSALLRYYNNWARQHGYRRRTERAIRQKICQLGLSAYPIGDWIRTTAISEALGISGTSVRRWIARLGLPATRDGARWAVRRCDLLDFAQRRPELFTMAPRQGLTRLLEDPATVDLILGGGHIRYPIEHSVHCVETGQSYPSLSAAARAHYVARQCIRQAVRSGGTAAGYHWELCGSAPELL